MIVFTNVVSITCGKCSVAYPVTMRFMASLLDGSLVVDSAFLRDELRKWGWLVPYPYPAPNQRDAICARCQK